MANNNMQKIQACGLQNRNELIDAYLSDSLREDKREAFEAHFFSCDACFDELQLRQDITDVAKKGVLKETAENYLARLAEKKTARLFGLPWLFTPAIRFAAVLVIFVGVSYGVYRAALPEFLGPAKLSDLEINYLQLEQKSGATPTPSELDRGAAALRNALQKRFGIFPFFEQARVDSAIVHFHNVYESSPTPSRLNYSAYFLGKAYLMKAEPDSACTWFNRVLATNQAEFQDEARELKGRIGCEGDGEKR